MSKLEKSSFHTNTHIVRIFLFDLKENLLEKFNEREKCDRYVDSYNPIIGAITANDTIKISTWSTAKRVVLRIIAKWTSLMNQDKKEK
jgi:hypothetical protein